MALAQDYEQKTLKVETHDLISEAFYHGEIDYFQKMKITSQVSGDISEVNINIGEKVKKNDVLFQINSKNIENQIDQTNNQITQLTHWLNNIYPSEKAALKAKGILLQNELNSDEKSKRSTVEALLKAYEEHIASKDEIKEAEQDLNLTLSQIKIKQSEQKIKEEQLESQKLNNKASVFKLIKEKEDLIKLLNNYTIKAPFDGTIMALNNSIVEQQLNHLEINEFMATIVNQDSKILNVLLPESEAFKLVNEKNNLCIIPRDNTKIACSLISVSLHKTPQGLDEYIASYDLLDKENKLTVGDTAEIRIKHILKKETLAIPIKSLVKNNNETGVIILEKGKKIFTPVSLGIFSADYVEIISGLKLNQEIFIQ